MVRALLVERDAEKQRAVEQQRRAEGLHIENLRLQVELARYKRWYYGPRADRLQTAGELAQLLLSFAESLDQKPVHPDDVPAQAEPEEEPRRVRRRKGRRHLANFDNLPVTTEVYELHGAERACPGCGAERREIGQQESWQIAYIPGRFERIHLCAQEVCLSGLRDQRREPAHRSGGQAGDGDREGTGRTGSAQLHRDQ